jgi:hypothetical protein
MAKVVESNISKLTPDDKNANKGTQYGQHLIENSMRKFGAGRSILLDKNNRIIAGNKATENAAAIGIEDVIIVESDGKKLIAVKRTDIDLDTPIGREMALADNATQKANLEWDEANIAELIEEYDIDIEEWGIPALDEDEEEQEDEQKKEISTRLIVECGDVTKLSLLFSELQDRGFKCELKE